METKEIKNEAQKRKDEVKLKYKKKLISEIAIVLFIGILIIFLILNGGKFFYKQNKDLVVNYDLSTDLIPDPIQNNISHELFTEKVKGIDIYYTKYASYDITGKVESIQDYSTNSLANLFSLNHSGIIDYISPRDLTLSWGEIALYKNAGHINMDSFYLNQGRNVYFGWDGYLSSTLGEDYITSHVSNNHLISTDSNIRNIINKVKINDIVRIQGYLVYVSTSSGSSWGPSSLTRTDTGGHACEIIYVTDMVIMP